MILSDFDIEQRRAKFEEELNSRKEVRSVTDVNYIGHTTHYFFKYPIPDGSYGICGVVAKILKLYEPETENKELFKVDLAVASHITGFYVEDLGLEVTSVVMEDPQGNKVSGICRYIDVDAVEETMNKKYDKGVGRPKLQLIVNNAGTQDTPVEPN